MRFLLPLFGFLHLALVFAWGQGMQSFKDRDEELALQRARALKEMKKAIDGPSAPAPLRIMAGGYQATGFDSAIARSGDGGARYEQMRREPLRLSVMTPQGLVPLETYHDPGWQSEQALQAARRAEEEGQGIGRRLESSIKAWRISLFDRNARIEGAPAGSLPAGNARAEPVESAASPRAEAASAEVIAIVEETPSQTPGGQPERKILGFLPSNRTGPSAEDKPVVYRGLQAQRQQAPESPETKVVGRGAKPGEEVAATSVGGSAVPEAVAGEGAREAQKSLLSRWFHRKGEDGLVVTGEEVALNPASPERQRSFFEGWFDRADGSGAGGAPGREGRQGRSQPDESALPDTPEGGGFMATDNAKTPFQVIDSGPGETFMTELSRGTVGRASGSGDQWVMLKLDTGLSGLVRKQHLRAATALEIQGYLAAERAAQNGPESLARRDGERVPAAGSAAVAKPAPAKRETAAPVVEKQPAPAAAENKPVQVVAEENAAAMPAEKPAAVVVEKAEPAMPEKPAAMVTGTDVPVPAGLMNPPPEKKPRVFSKPLEEVLKSLE